MYLNRQRYLIIFWLQESQLHTLASFDLVTLHSQSVSTFAVNKTDTISTVGLAADDIIYIYRQDKTDVMSQLCLCYLTTLRIMFLHGFQVFILGGYVTHY